MEPVGSLRRSEPLIGFGLVVVGVVMLVAFSSAAATASAGDSRLPVSAMSLPTVAEYSVSFTETGLPSGTSWSVTLNGSPQSSAGPSINFVEPNGSYVFTVGSVPGYTVAPEGNVTVQGASVSVPVTFVSTTSEPQACTSFFWSDANNVLSGDCLGFFQADYRAFNVSTGETIDNSTFTVGPLAEVTASGAVAALGTLGFQGSGLVTVTSTPQEINVTDVIVGNVTTAIGLNSTTGEPNGQTPQWIPSELPGGGASTTWGAGPQVLGGITVGIVFHFQNSSGTSANRVKIDVLVSGWPWMSPNDVLGLAIEMEAFALPGGSHFSYSASSDTITQQWDSNDSAISSLAFGPTANVTGGTSPTVNVADQVELSASGPDPTAAFALLTFTGAGGYSKLVYDPWLVFGAQVQSTTGPLTMPVNGASLPLVAVGGIALGAAVLGIVTYRIRRRPVDDGLASAG
jgi:hypothetical protein